VDIFGYKKNRRVPV